MTEDGKLKEEVIKSRLSSNNIAQVDIDKVIDKCGKISKYTTKNYEIICLIAKIYL
jgi:hypothetical protein